MATAMTMLPTLFYKRWTDNYKKSNKFTQHDNRNQIQNFGEYIDTGYGKRYFQDTIHVSNDIFFSKEQFVKRDTLETKDFRHLRTNSTPAYTHHRRFPKRHETKVTSAGEHKRINLNEYLELKESKQPINSLNFESEHINKLDKIESAKLIATQPFKKHFIQPWKYSYKTIDYQTCNNDVKRVRTTCIDLSKY